MGKNEEKTHYHPEPESCLKAKAPARNANILEDLFGRVVKNNEALTQGLANLATLPEIGGRASMVAPVFQRPIIEGVMGFRREGGALGLTVAGGTAQARLIQLGKFVALVERMYDLDRPTIVLQNPVEHEQNRSGRGQLLGRIIPASSALVVGLGYSGRIVASLEDFIRVDVYYLSRSMLAAFYLAAKVQLSTENSLNELITAFEGWYKFGIPQDPCIPFALESATEQVPA